MRIGLYNGSTLYPLAGASGVSERTHSSAADVAINPSAALQVVSRVRATHALHLDRGNLATSISFTTSRKFATVEAAELWALDYDADFPRTGKLVMETVLPDGNTRVRVMADAVVSPPQRRLNGATIQIAYAVQGGAIGEGTAATATINPTGEDNSILYTALTAGPVGNAITIEYAISGAGAAVISVGVTGTAILITAGSTTTAASVITAVNADTEAAALVIAAASGTVTGVIDTVAASNLTGGAY